MNETDQFITETEQVLTETESLQNELISTVQEIYDRTDLCEIALDREKHLEYLRKGFLHGLPSAYVSLDASRPWLVYWALQSFDLLGYKLSPVERERTIATLKRFHNEIEGGFCGSENETTGHLSHLAPTYASILSIAILEDPSAYTLIHRPALKSLLHRLKQPNGAFRMHAIDGEIDVRAVYCAVVSGKLTGCWDEQLEAGIVDWIAQCQTWEGGFCGVPGAEAHGGYTFCAVATLKLLSPSDIFIKINRKSLLYWLTSQQVQPLGGFRGRTHKLVDGCYSFWQAAAFDCIGEGNFIDSPALQRYILAACQDESKGGLRDKPGKSPDFYHTCYCLSGLSIAQHQISDPEFILGGPSNLLKPVDPEFNLVRGKAATIISFFELNK